MQLEADERKLEEDKKKREETQAFVEKVRVEVGDKKDALLEEQKQRDLAFKQQLLQKD